MSEGRRLAISHYILSQLKSCPFCGSNTILVLDLHLICLNCGAKGPRANSDDEAIFLWEKRAQETAATPETKKPHGQPSKSASGESEVL
jgi:hypothetical protein